MLREFHEKYDKYVFKVDIAKDIDLKTRGVFATEDIHIGDILMRIPSAEILKGSHIDLTHRLKGMNNEYTRSLPVDMTNFPVLWTPKQLKSLEGCAMRDMIVSRRKKLMEELQSESPIDLRNRLLVGSRGFTMDKETVLMVPYADMMNHAKFPNVDWKYNGENFVMRAVKEVLKGEQLFDSYGTKTNYENLLFYGMVLPDNLENDITYEILTIPIAMRKNLNFDFFSENIEFELCGSYSRGTVEIFSLMRFLICANAKPSECPKTLIGLSCEPISIKNECMVAKMMFNFLLKIYNEKIIKMKDVQGEVAEFVHTEIRCILHWLGILPDIIRILEEKTFKKAMKRMNKLKPSDYLQKAIRPLIKKKHFI